MMTRKDYERIAQVFRVNKPSVENTTSVRAYYAEMLLWETMLGDMHVELRAINKNFDSEKFESACRT
jgi:hypothetical protein